MNSRRLPLLYILLSLLVLLLGLSLGFTIEPMWLARMGSVMVLLGALAEYTLFKQEMSSLYYSIEHDCLEAKLPPSFWHQHKSYMAHTIVIVGTLVWGFGDLLL